MSFALADLFGSVKSQMNPVGGSAIIGDADEDEVVAGLADAFWTAKITGGFFSSYRVNVAGTDIEHVDGGDDLERDAAQLIVLVYVVSQLQIRLENLATSRRIKAGPNEVERQQSAQLLRALLDRRAKQLDKLIEDLQDAGRDDLVGILNMPGIAAATGRDFIL